MHSTGIATLITSISFNRRKLPSMLLKLMNVDEMVERHGIKNIYKRTRLEVTRNILALVLIATVIHLIGYVAQCDWTFLSVLHVSVENFVMTFNILITVLYAHLTRILKCRYKYIIEDLEEYFKVDGAPVSTDCVGFSRNYLPNMFYCKDFTLFRATRPSSLSMSSESYKIRMLRYVYIQLFDCVGLLNSYFGIPILFAILTVMLTSVSALYGGVYFLQIGDGDVNLAILASFMILLGVQFLISFAWLVTCCHATSAEAGRGAVSVQRITACSELQRETSAELEKLSSQLDKMKVQFTACGFFTLNLPLLCTLIGGILTYILIAVQMT
jgi:hypothetical protein